MEGKRVPVPKPGPDDVSINIKYSGSELRDLIGFNIWFLLI